MVRRIGLVSDIHGNFLALRSIVEDIKRRDVSIIVNLGDHISGPLWPKETINFLKDTNWIHIKGNHDRQLTETDPNRLGLSDSNAYKSISHDDLNWIQKLNSIIELDDDIIAFHGCPENDNQYLLEEIIGGHIFLRSIGKIEAILQNIKQKIILCGHSHTPRCVRLNNGKVIVNPGSVGLQAYIDDDVEAHSVEIGSPHARYSILEINKKTINIENYVIEYDWNTATKKAMESKRMDWISGLSMGFLNKKTFTKEKGNRPRPPGSGDLEIDQEKSDT